MRADHSYVRLYKREAPTQCRFVASRRPPRRLLVTSRGDVSWRRLVETSRGGGGLWTSILFECCACERWSAWTSPGRISVDVSPRERVGGLDRTAFRLTMRATRVRLPKCRHSIWVLLHYVGGCMLSSRTWE